MVFLTAAFVRAVSAADEPAAGVAAGEPIAGGAAKGKARFMLPPGTKAPQWTDAERERGYVVFTDSYLNSFWPRQEPTRRQITDELSCRLARNEYEPIQIGICATSESEALKNVRLEISIDLNHEVRRLHFYHGIEGWRRVDGPFCYPAPEMEVADYDRIRAKAEDYLSKLGIERMGDLPPVPYEKSKAPKWEAAPFEGKSVDECIAALGAAAPQTRRSAAAALALRGEGAAPAVKALAAQLADPDVRIPALRALGAIGLKAAVAAADIDILLTDRDEYLRMCAALALSGMGPRAVPGLRKALGDSSPQVVQIVGTALARLGGDAAPAVPDLIPLLESSNSAVRRGAIKALEGIGSEASPATDALAKVFKESGCRNRYAALALAAIGPAAKRAVPILKTRHDKSRYYDAFTNYALFAITGDQAYLHGIMRILNSPGDRYVVGHTAELIGSLDARAAAIAPAVKGYLNAHDKLGKDVRTYLKTFLGHASAGAAANSRH